jgi:hypothetical protein
MCGIGRKDQDGRQVRVEHRGKNLRASRTGGVAARAEKKIGPVNATVNTTHGLRLSTRLARGLHVGLQNGKTRLVGRWGAGPFAFNLSKSGVSTSMKTSTGRLNLLKPQYSSFKLGGVQVRGRTAAQLQVITLLFQLAFWAVAALLNLVILVASLLFRMVYGVFWLGLTLLMVGFDVMAGVFSAVRTERVSNPPDGDR